MKKLFIIILLCITIKQIAQEIRLGEQFNKYEKDFILKGISSSTSNKYYEFLKPITRLIYDRKVDKLYVTIRNNKIISYIYMIIPKSNDINIPKDIISGFENEMNVKLIYNNGKYGIKGSGLMTQFSREYDPETKKDRIMISTAISN